MYYYTNPKASSGSGTPNAIASSLSSSLSKSAEKSSSSKLQQQHFQLKDDLTTKDANGKKVRTSYFFPIIIFSLEENLFLLFLILFKRKVERNPKKL